MNRLPSLRAQRLVLPLAAALLLTGCAGGGLTRDNARDAAQTNAQLGATYLQRGDLDQAKTKLERALEQDEDNALAHVAYAQLQQRVNRNDSARFHFERAIELQPDEAEHKNAFGAFLCSVGDVDQAELQFRQAATDPFYDTPEYALDNAGLCMLDAGNLDQAETYLRDALRMNPRFPGAWLHMAELLHRRDRLTVADAYYQRYVTLGPRTAESLLLGHVIKRDAGDIASAETYANQLLNEFPASLEAGEYLSRPLN